MRADHVAILKAECAAQQVPLDLAAALILKENDQLIPNAERFEKNFYIDNLMNKGRHNLAGYVPPNDPPSLDTEKAARARSYGYFQILGDQARVIGFKNQWLTDLFDPAIGIHWGVANIKYCLSKVPPLTSDYSSYKAFSDRWNGGGDPTYFPALVKILQSNKPEALLQTA